MQSLRWRPLALSQIVGILQAWFYLRPLKNLKHLLIPYKIIAPLFVPMMLRKIFVLVLNSERHNLALLFSEVQVLHLHESAKD